MCYVAILNPPFHPVNQLSQILTQELRGSDAESPKSIKDTTE
jgi:hypothetical protein